MPFITTAERIGIEKGIQQGIQQGFQIGLREGEREGLLMAIELGLTIKFPDEGLQVYSDIEQIEDVDVLQAVVEALMAYDDLDSVIAVTRRQAGAQMAQPTDGAGGDG